MPPRHHHLRAAAEGGGSGLSQDGAHLGLGFNEGGGNCLHSDGCGAFGKRREARSRATRSCAGVEGGATGVGGGGLSGKNHLC